MNACRVPATGFGGPCDPAARYRRRRALVLRTVFFFSSFQNDDDRRRIVFRIVFACLTTRRRWFWIPVRENIRGDGRRKRLLERGGERFAVRRIPVKPTAGADRRENRNRTDRMGFSDGARVRKHMVVGRIAQDVLRGRRLTPGDRSPPPPRYIATIVTICVEG